MTGDYVGNSLCLIKRFDIFRQQRRRSKQCHLRQTADPEDDILATGVSEFVGNDIGSPMKR
jgi:hypothetical protein